MRTEYDFLHIIRRTSDDHFIHQATSWHFVTCWFPQWWPDQGPRGLCNWNMSKIYKFIQIAGRKNIHPKTLEHQPPDKPQWPHLALGFCSELLFNLPQRLLVRCRREPCLDTIFFVFRHQHSAWWPQYAEKSGCVVILNLPQELSSPAMFGPCPRVHHHINSIAHANSKCNVCIYMFCYMHPYIVDPCSSPAELIFPDNTS